MVHQNRKNVVKAFVLALLLVAPVFAQQQPGLPCCPEFDNGAASACGSFNCAIDFKTRANIQKVTRDHDVTLTLTAPTYASFVSLRLIHANSGAVFTVTFSPAVKWPNGVGPTFTNTANAIDIVTLFWDGANWYGVLNTAFA